MALRRDWGRLASVTDLVGLMEKKKWINVLRIVLVQRAVAVVGLVAAPSGGDRSLPAVLGQNPTLESVDRPSNCCSCAHFSKDLR